MDSEIFVFLDGEILGDEKFSAKLMQRIVKHCFKQLKESLHNFYWRDFTIKFLEGFQLNLKVDKNCDVVCQACLHSF